MPVITVTISSFIEHTAIPKEVGDETAMEAIKTVVLPALAALADFFKRI